MNKFVSAGGSKGQCFPNRMGEVDNETISKMEGAYSEWSKGAAAPSRFEGQVTLQNFNIGKENKGN